MTLTEYMARLDLTQVEMARRLGVSLSGLGKWIRGERIPRPRSMVRIREATGGLVAPEDFMPSLSDPELHPSDMNWKALALLATLAQLTLRERERRLRKLARPSENKPPRGRAA